MSKEYEQRLPLIKIKCICPKCRKTHVRRIPWTGGAVTPRIFCPDCKDAKRRTLAKRIYRLENYGAKAEDHGEGNSLALARVL